MAATFCEVWEGVTSLIAEVDVLAGFAELATSAPVAYVRPTMLPSDAGEISLIGCRCIILTPPPLTHMWWPIPHVPSAWDIKWLFVDKHCLKCCHFN